MYYWLATKVVGILTQRPRPCFGEYPKNSTSIFDIGSEVVETPYMKFLSDCEAALGTLNDNCQGLC